MSNHQDTPLALQLADEYETDGWVAATPQWCKAVLQELLRLNQIAEGATWQPIATAPTDQFVLLACPSGYSTTPYIYTTGIKYSDYKVGRWIDHANDDLSDWGMEPTHWRPAPDQPQTKESTA